jgi:hypothetical protein
VDDDDDDEVDGPRWDLKKEDWLLGSGSRSGSDGMGTLDGHRRTWCVDVMVVVFEGLDMLKKRGRQNEEIGMLVDRLRIEAKR